MSDTLTNSGPSGTGTTPVEENSEHNKTSQSDIPVTEQQDVSTQPHQPVAEDVTTKEGAQGSPSIAANSRFTVLAEQCPSIAPNWEDPQGVPISGFIFGSRRARVVPLVFEAFDWPHGVFLGSAMGTETTAAITGKVGVVRRDPMAMLPFCGYNMADYFSHWLGIGQRLAKPPKIFRVNWFRRGPDGSFLWPGYGENMRVLKWMVERIRGTARAAETPIGSIPAPGSLDLQGLTMPADRLARALNVDSAEWLSALDDLDEFYGQFGGRLPETISKTLSQTRRKLGAH